jgi:hypothetical protein
MKILKQLVCNIALTTATLYSVFVAINLVELLFGKLTETDFWGVVVFTFISAILYSSIFILIHFIMTLGKGSIFVLREHKLFLAIPLLSSFIVEYVDFRWFGLIQNIDNALYINYIILSFVSLLLSLQIIRLKNYKNNN